MYKKIKNSSFMNLIWFTLCMLPFILLLIYALGFFNNEELRANEQDNYTLTLNSISGSTQKQVNNLQETYLDSNTLGTINENGYYVTNQVGIHKIRFKLYTTGPNDQLIFDDSILTNNNFYYLSFMNNTNDTYEFNIYITYSYVNNGTINTSYQYDTSNAFTNENYFQLDISNWYQQTKTYLLNNYNNVNITNLYITFNKTSSSPNDYLEYYPILTNEKIYIDNNFYNNYKTYINDFNTIKYNSCPISYTYNNNTYNIKTNSNNYLGTNKTIEINQNFNYTLNEQPILNYNNYFISNIIENTIQAYGEDKGNNLIQNSYTFQVCTNLEYNENYTYYTIDEETNNYIYRTSVTTTNYSRLRNRLYIIIETQTTYDYEYYNIESTINTSLTLIPNNNFSDFLNNVNNTIQTNGFISSAFLNLATLFGVNNVYYSLACYYIEYLLVIALLHLAFDVLYMLPNICHKFMEKLGGERD